QRPVRHGVGVGRPISTQSRAALFLVREIRIASRKRTDERLPRGALIGEQLAHRGLALAQTTSRSELAQWRRVNRRIVRQENRIIWQLRARVDDREILETTIAILNRLGTWKPCRHFVLTISW